MNQELNKLIKHARVANVAAAMQLLKTSRKGKTVAVLLSDSGLKYLSTDLWL